jgi:hypothetical protein
MAMARYLHPDYRCCEDFTRLMDDDEGKLKQNKNIPQGSPIRMKGREMGKVT